MRFILSHSHINSSPKNRQQRIIAQRRFIFSFSFPFRIQIHYVKCVQLHPFRYLIFRKSFNKQHNDRCIQRFHIHYIFYMIIQFFFSSSFSLYLYILTECEWDSDWEWFDTSPSSRTRISWILLNEFANRL